MKIVVVGGSGRIGSRLVGLLARDGHEAVAASRRTGVDVVTGEGLADAVRGAAAVVDVSDAPSFDDAAAMSFFTASTSTLLAAETAAGVGHHVMLSVVGADRLRDGGYFRAKCAQEALIAAAGIPYSILRATQFFEFLTTIADAATHGGVARIPPAHVQPIAADDVARALARLVTGAPVNGTIELGGPESFYLDGLIQRILGARHDRREVVADRHAHYFGAVLGDRSLVAGDEADLGEIRFEQWLGSVTHQESAPGRGPAEASSADGSPRTLGAYEFRVDDVPPGSVVLLGDVAVFSVEGGFCATQARCSHRQGPLSEGTVDGSTVTCPLHGARFNVWTGAALSGPATSSLQTYAVTIEGDVGRVEVPCAGDAAAMTRPARA
jgi:uncharacterized protein YbjT (DUF2867 family)/nitrite reductase/ring-hydroxylating ferredoxin subunit